MPEARRSVVDDETGAVEFAAPWMPVVLEAFRASMNASSAAKAAGVSHAAVLQARRRDPVFSACFDEVCAENVARIEGSAFRDAENGRDAQGRMFLLKSWAPERYSERLELRHSGTVRHELESTNGADPLSLPPATRREMARLLLEAAGTIDGTASDAGDTT